MGARQKYQLQHDVREEYANVQKAGRKRSLWASIGSTIAGAAAFAFTGGLASPLLAAAAAGGASYLGGHAGSLAARESKLGGSGRIRGGKFLQGSREGLIGQIGSKITSGALKAAITAGVMKGGWQAIQKGAKSGDFSSLWKAKEGAKGWGAGTLKGGAQGGFGKGLDIGGSWAGKKFSAHALGKEIAKGGFVDPGLQGTVAKGAKPIVAMDRLKHSPAAKISASSLRGQNQWDILKNSDPVVGGKIAETAQMQYKTPGAKGALQRILPGGESGYQGEIPKGPGLSHAEVDIRNYYEKVGMDDPVHISRKMPKSTLLKDVSVGDDFLESSNIKNTPRYVAGRHGEESYFSKALDTDDIIPSELRGRPGKTDYLQDLKPHSSYYEMDIGQAQESARISEGLKNYQFSDQAEGMRVNPYGGRTPTSYGPGISGEILGDPKGSNLYDAYGGFTRGESFPVQSPDLQGNIGEAFTSSPSYDYQSIAGERQRKLLSSLRYQNLFGR